MSEEKKPPKSLTEKAAEYIGNKIVENETSDLEHRLAILTEEQLKEMQIIENRVLGQSGSIDDMEAALGLLRVGHHFGWRVLVVVHNKKTIRKYEEILGIKIREFFPERGPSSYRSSGLKIAESLGNFWKAVSGDIKIDKRRDIE